MIHKNRTTHRHVKRATTEVGLPASLAARLFLPRKPTNKNFNHRHAKRFKRHYIIRPELKKNPLAASAILQVETCICFSIAETWSDLRPV
jgi:hypothetical protein